MKHSNQIIWLLRPMIVFLNLNYWFLVSPIRIETQNSSQFQIIHNRQKILLILFILSGLVSHFHTANATVRKGFKNNPEGYFELFFVLTAAACHILLPLSIWLQKHKIIELFQLVHKNKLLFIHKKSSVYYAKPFSVCINLAITVYAVISLIHPLFNLIVDSIPVTNATSLHLIVQNSKSYLFLPLDESRKIGNLLDLNILDIVSTLTASSSLVSYGVVNYSCTIGIFYLVHLIWSMSDAISCKIKTESVSLKKEALIAEVYLGYQVIKESCEIASQTFGSLISWHLASCVVYQGRYMLNLFEKDNLHLVALAISFAFPFLTYIYAAEIAVQVRFLSKVTFLRPLIKS